ncbi:hypothetical protein MASR2M8_10050 [Opitutaceae bacterium]
MQTRGAAIYRLAAALCLTAVCLLPLQARAEIERRFTVSAPDVVMAGTAIEIVVMASTDAADGEKAVYLQAEYSIDGGRRWQVGLWEDVIGIEGSRRFTFTTGQAGSVAFVRARIAFRGGLAGAVDYRGGAIRWFDTWKKWAEPPARSIAIKVTGR